MVTVCTMMCGTCMRPSGWPRMDVTRATVRQSVTTTAGMFVQQPNVPTLNSHVNAMIQLPINVSHDVFVVISNGNA